MQRVGKKYYLSAAPQCVFPDAADGTTLDAVAFDLVLVQFYNNWCETFNFQVGSSTQSAFNFGVWDNWAKSSKNPAVKVFLGFPANTGRGRWLHQWISAQGCHRLFKAV